MTLEKKSVAVIDEVLPIGIAFNTLAHLALAIGKNAKNIIGKKTITDATGTIHKGLSTYPFIILKANSAKIKKIVNEAKGNTELLVIDFPEQAYTKYTDEGFQEAVSKIKEEKIQYYGVALFGSVVEIDKLTKDLQLWK